MTNNKIQRFNDYLEVSENQRKNMKTSSFCFGIFNDKPSSYWGTTTHVWKTLICFSSNIRLLQKKRDDPSFRVGRTLASRFLAKIPKQAFFTPSGFQGERPKKQPNTPDIASKNIKLKNPNDSLGVFWRDQILGFDFYACMEPAWTTVLASHKGLRASAPHNSLPSLGLDARKAHLSMWTNQALAMHAGTLQRSFCLVRFIKSKAWKCGGFTLGVLAHGLFCPKEISEKHTCSVNISIFREEPWDVLFHLAMAKNWTHKVTVISRFLTNPSNLQGIFLFYI